jgi:hypothetical protein
MISEYSFDWYFISSCDHPVGVDMRNLGVMTLMLSFIKHTSVKEVLQLEATMAVPDVVEHSEI